MPMIWTSKHPDATLDHLGIIPEFLSVGDPRPAREQFAGRYIGGWSPFPGFSLLPNGNLSYPGDPETQLLFETRLRKEVIRVYDHAWVTVTQPDGSWEASRLD